MKTGHKHGGNPLAELARLNLPERKIIDFSVNVNPLGMPDIIKRKWESLVNAVHDYPSVNGEGITGFYTYKTGVMADEFLAGNGSTELIYLIPRALKFKKVFIPVPSFYDYERASLLAGAQVLSYPLKPVENFSFPSIRELEAVIHEVERDFSCTAYNHYFCFSLFHIDSNFLSG